MDEEPHVEFAPSSKLLIGDPRLDDAVDFDKRTNAMLLFNLDRFRAPDKQVAWFKEHAEPFIKKDITDLHKEHGIDLPNNAFPTIVYIPESNKKALRKIVPEFGELTHGKHIGSLHTAVVFIRPENRFLDAETTYHESMHGVGRYVQTTTLTSYGDGCIVDAVGGYVTSFRGKKPGSVLEEMCAGYFSRKALTGTQDKAISDERNAFINDHADMLRNVGVDPSDTTSAASELLTAYIERTYDFYNDLMLEIMSRADNKGMKDETVKAFLEGRIDTSKKHRTYEVLRTLFTKDIAKTLMTAHDMSETELKKLLVQMKAYAKWGV